MLIKNYRLNYYLKSLMFKQHNLTEVSKNLNGNLFVF